MTYVTPKKVVPPSAEPAPTVKPNADALMILDASLGDYVDGGNSRCFDESTGPAFARAEIARLGLTGWKVAGPEVMPKDPDAGKYPEDTTPRECGWFWPYENMIVFAPNKKDDPSTPGPDGPGGGMYEVATALRKGISEQCVSLPEAEDITTKALGKLHHWPTSAVADKDLKCTTVDLQVGGSMQVFLRGPK